MRRTMKCSRGFMHRHTRARKHSRMHVSACSRAHTQTHAHANTLACTHQVLTHLLDSLPSDMSNLLAAQRRLVERVSDCQNSARNGPGNRDTKANPNPTQKYNRRVVGTLAPNPSLVTPHHNIFPRLESKVIVLKELLEKLEFERTVCMHALANARIVALGDCTRENRNMAPTFNLTCTRVHTPNLRCLPHSIRSLRSRVCCLNKLACSKALFIPASWLQMPTRA